MSLIIISMFLFFATDKMFAVYFEILRFFYEPLFKFQKIYTFKRLRSTPLTA